MAYALPEGMANPEDFAAWQPGAPRTASAVGPPMPAADAPVPPDIARARTLSRVLDHYLVDPLLGLILPGAGDLIGSLLGLYVVGIAVRRRMSPVIIARMLLNLALDAGIGFLPLVGDIADFVFKANEKNLALLVDRHDTGRATARDWLTVAGAALAFAAVIALMIYAVVAVVRAIG
ncbi:MAG: DUF4112 domain-containing protein [Deltaproteobacteria bacterium]|nr:MAG: DUF4112 domain-containing protein [Deltaproteobacteria bacterium]